MGGAEGPKPLYHVLSSGLGDSLYRTSIPLLPHKESSVQWIATLGRHGLKFTDSKATGSGHAPDLAYSGANMTEFLGMHRYMAWRKAIMRLR